MPAISPTGLGATSYAITASRRIQADLKFDFFLGSEHPFTVTYPTAAAGVQITLSRGGTSLNLLPGPINDFSTFGNRTVITSSSPAGANTVLTCTVSVNSTEVLDEAWTVRITADAAVDWAFGQNANSPADPTIPRLMCDPVAQISSVVPSAPQEKDAVLLTAGLANGLGTVVGPSTPAFYRWSYTGDIVISGFSSAASASQTHAFNAPGVYGSRTVTLSLETWLEGDSMTPGFLTASATQPMTLTPRTQHLMLVLDRSGSMAGERWNNAVVAARILAQMYLALRAGVSEKDRVGILTFEDGTAIWRPFYGPDVGIELKLPLTPAGSGTGIPGLCSLNLGAPGNCTPIGDALIEAMRKLAPLHSASSPPKYHVVLLTDGYENSGSVYLKSTPSAVAAGAQSFASRRASTVGGSVLGPVDANMALYPIGLGATVDDEVLNQLGWANTTSPTPYRNITQVSQLKQAFAQMVGYSQEAQELISAASPAALEALLMGVDVPDDAGAPTGRYVAVEPKANRLIFAVQWGAGTHTLELARAEAGGTFIPISVPVAACTSHGFVTVDLASLYGGEALVPQTFWRIVHKEGGAATVIPPDDLLAYVDLTTKLDVTFDKREYRTGDTMRVTASLRQGNKPIRGARVKVELARPGESLGTFLAVNSGLYTPRQSEPGKGGDVPPPKEDMLRVLMKAKKLDSLLVPGPAALFPDGSSDLRDDGAHHDGAADDGDYANVYTRVDKEGVYTWRISAVGRLEDGSAFTRVMTVSTWAGIRPDAASSIITYTHDLPAPRGMAAVRVSISPRDRFKEHLGPFRGDELKFESDVGTFEGDITQDLDGTYHQVLYYPLGEKPQVTIHFAHGKASAPLPIFPVTESLLCRFFKWLAHLFCKDC
ncbi:hypothetical protein NR800_18155 [Corallococcus interemptor]|uniref:vWA domain-containing protein n=1 Tax=Corallococcus interemptor TaxID=2316720 RepID=UPI0035D4733B